MKKRMCHCFSVLLRPSAKKKKKNELSKTPLLRSIIMNGGYIESTECRVKKFKKLAYLYIIFFFFRESPRSS